MNYTPLHTSGVNRWEGARESMNPIPTVMNISAIEIPRELYICEFFLKIFKTCLIERSLHVIIKNASFPSPIDVRYHIYELYSGRPNPNPIFSHNWVKVKIDEFGWSLALMLSRSIDLYRISLFKLKFRLTNLNSSSIQFDRIERLWSKRCNLKFRVFFFFCYISWRSGKKEKYK